VPHADEVSSEAKDGIQFFHPGSNWSGVECPVCGSDAEEWFDDVLDQAEGFENLMRRTGCCNAKVSLNELRFIWAAAFGSYALVAMNPDIEELPVAQQSELERELGCVLRQVWTHL
jgi:hypothetical protein